MELQSGQIFILKFLKYKFEFLTHYSQILFSPDVFLTFSLSYLSFVLYTIKIYLFFLRK